jgi:hypothetical protein
MAAVAAEARPSGGGDSLLEGMQSGLDMLQQ